MNLNIITNLIIMALALASPLSAAGDHYDRSGKMGSVVLVVALVIIGFVVILFVLERKIKKMEDKLN